MKRKPRFTITMDTSAELMNNLRERGSAGRAVEILIVSIVGEKMERIQGRSRLDEICQLKAKPYKIIFQQIVDRSLQVRIKERKQR